MPGKIILFISLLLTIEGTSAQQNNSDYTIVPYPICMKGLQHNDSLTIDELLCSGGIECCSPGFQVISFTLAFGGNCLRPGGMYSEVNSTSNRFTNQMISIIKKYPKNVPVWIDNVIVRNRTGKLYKLKSKAIFIK